MLLCYNAILLPHKWRTALKHINIALVDADWKSLKHLAVEEKTTITALVREAITKFLDDDSGTGIIIPHPREPVIPHAQQWTPNHSEEELDDMIDLVREAHTTDLMPNHPDPVGVLNNAIRSTQQIEYKPPKSRKKPTPSKVLPRK